MSTTFLGLGGNLGDRQRFLIDAVKALNAEPGFHVGKISSVFETQPVGVVDQPDFLNLVLELSSEFSAREILARCSKIEAKLGRVRVERWGPRTIDIDLLWHDDQTINEPDLVLPHPRMLLRAFVLVPLAEIAPELSLGGMSARVLAARLDQTGLRRLGTFESLAE